VTTSKTIIITVGLWFVLCSFAAYYYVTSILALPDLSPGYKSDWVFQLMMFALVRFPFWIAGLLVIIMIEVVMLKRITKDDKGKSGL
jgi:hypothetical protein